MNQTRRQLITGVSLVGAGVFLAGCRKEVGGSASAGVSKRENKADEQSSDEAAAEVSATEDLMREHGILRRALLVLSRVCSQTQTGSEFSAC